MSSKQKGKTKKKDQDKDSEQSVAGKDIALVNTSDIPVLATGDLVAFPTVMMSLYILDEKNKIAINQATEKDDLILIVAANRSSGEQYQVEDLPKIGVVAQISRVLNLNDGRMKVLLQGLYRVRVSAYSVRDDSFFANVEVIEQEEVKLNKEIKVTIDKIKKQLQSMVELELLPEEMLLVTEEIQDPAVLSDVIIAHYKLDVQYAQSLLEELDPVKRLTLTAKVIEDDFNSFMVAENVRSKTQDELTKGQRDYYLREQLKQIRKELGEEDVASEDIAELKKALKKAKLPKHAKVESDRQLKRLDRMAMESSEYAMLRTYLEWMAELPWSKRTKEKLDLSEAQKILDEDHYGLKKAKDRILEFLSVRKLKKDTKGPILCFLGPPGVGKTSLGRSIAKALNREFVRMSLGGMRDEAEIRGHRRTYVGALPGRIIQGLKTAGSTNPVFMLDELDKIGSDYRGDPSDALLEILDPQQNKDFSDHYLNIGYDLSECFFVATANTLDTIPDPLLDRLEVISIPGYTSEEKLNIAKRYLVPRQLEANGIEGQGIAMSDEALLFLIERYTKEAGVRNLEREISGICRKLARQIVEEKKVDKKITPDKIKKLLGSTKVDPEFSGQVDQIGLVNGLAWTMNGGEIMTVEVSVAPGKGDLTLTGQLGSVLQESGQAAVFFARANSKSLGLDAKFHEHTDIHIHLPEGATPKDGPSAGITLLTALVSALSDRKVKSSVAMTGEITLRGNVLPIGGLKEKALAALRYGIKTVIIPHGNVKDLKDIPKNQLKDIEFIPVKTVQEVLEHALVPKKVKASRKPVKKTDKKKASKKKTTKAKVIKKRVVTSR